MGTLLGGGEPRTVPIRYAGIQISTSMQGQPIPYVAGRTRVTMNLGWYGDFSSSPSNSGSKGGNPPSGYNYRTAFIGLLCLGPIKSINQVFSDRSLTTLALQNLSYALGSSGQPTWSGYPSGTPAGQQIPYDHIAYVASNNYYLGGSPSMPDLTYEVEGVVGGYYNAGSVYDADPSVIITDYLTDSVHGAGFLGTIDTSLLTGVTNTYQAYCMSLGILLSPYEYTQRAATDFLREIMQCTNSDIILSGGVLKVIPYADQPVSGTTPDGVNWSYTPDLTPEYSFTDSDYVPKEGEPPVTLKRKAISETFNIVNVECVDRSDYYNPMPVTASDLNDISLRGPRVMNTLSLHEITSSTVARTVAQLILQFQLYERNSYEFRVRADYSLLEPMDYIALTDANLGLEDQVCRVTQIQDDEHDYFTITAMEVPGVVRSTPQYNWNSSQGFFQNFDAEPENVVAPIIFVMPPIPGAFSNGIPIGIAVSGQTSDGAWGGCQVYCSVDGGNNYSWIGTAGKPNATPRYGTTNTSITAGSGNPDTANTLGVLLANTTAQIETSVTDADAASMQTLCLVGNGSTAEIISFGAASLISAGDYNLSYLYRGLYGSTNQSHASGVNFVRLDGSIFQIAMDPGMAGQTVYFKFCSYNTLGRMTQDLSSVTAYSYTIPQAIQSPNSIALAARGSAVINGEYIYKATTGATAWDSDAVAKVPLTSGNLSGQYTGAYADALGFVTSTSGSVNPTSAGFYGFESGSGVTGGTVVYENGTIVYTGTTPAVGDLYDVRYDGYQLLYYLNGVLVWTTLMQGVGLYPALAFYKAGDALSNVQVASGTTATPTQWKATGNTVISNTSISKNGGSSAWDSTAYSLQGYPTCYVGGKANSLSGDYCMLGLSSTPAANRGYNNNEYSWYNGNGTWYIYEGGTNEGSFGLAALTDKVWITYDGSNVRYYKNDPTTAVRTTVLAGATLYGYIALENASCLGWNSVEFGPSTIFSIVDTSGLGANAATNLAYTVDDSTYATTYSGTTIATSYPGSGFAIPYASSPILSFTATASQDVIVTATGTIYFNNTSPTTVVSAAFIGIVLIDTSASNAVIEYSPHAGVGHGFNNISCAGTTVSPTPTQQFAFQMEAPVTQGHVYDVIVFIQTSASQVTAETTSVQLQVETIKR